MDEQYVYIVGDAITSREGIEGVLGYSPVAIYASEDIARLAAVEQMKAQYKRKSDVTWSWVADEDSADIVVLHVTYEATRQIWETSDVLRYDTDIYGAVIKLPVQTGVEVVANG